MDRPALGKGIALTVVVWAAAMAVVWGVDTNRWAEPIPYVAPPGAQTGPPPAPNARMRKTRGTFSGVVDLDGGRTGFNDRELVLGSSGPLPRGKSPEDGCGADIIPMVVEDTAERIVLQGQTFAGRNERGTILDRAETVCNAMGYGRTAYVQLSEPLAGRKVFDVGNPAVPLPIVDGSMLLVPGWLPDGYELASEGRGGFTYEHGPTTRWDRGGTDAPGLSISQAIESTIIPRLSADQPPVDVEEALTRLEAAGRAVTVRGRRGAIIRDVSFLPIALLWHEDGRWFSISSERTSDSDAAADTSSPSDDDLLRVAESLHTVTG